jgi:AmmeMemoRadiSam system protein A
MSRLSSDDWLALVGIARRAISSAILEKSIPDFPPYPAALSERRGAFVSLYCGGILRGCVGQVEDPGPLVDVIARSAINAALYDSRFPSIIAEEVTTLEIEISVLTAPERILPEAIVAGWHGLLVVRGSFRGLLLPQVAAERNWPGQRLLEETCIKAGLGRDAWRDPATDVFGFTAEVFSEKGPRTIPEP